MMIEQNKTDHNMTDSTVAIKIIFIGLESFGFVGNSISILVFSTILYDVNHNKRINPIAIIPKFKFYW